MEIEISLANILICQWLADQLFTVGKGRAAE